MRILFATPGYWPSTAFGGPIAHTRELARSLQARGHTVEVVTTSLVSLETRPDRMSRVDVVDGASVHYLGTPLRYRWMGVTPSIWGELRGLVRPDVVHIFGFRDFVGTVTARWARHLKIPYVFEGLGMVEPKLRKRALKLLLDTALYRQVPQRAALCLAASRREQAELLTAGVVESRSAVRPIGFPAPVEPLPRPGPLRRLLGLDAATPLVLSLGRVAPGKGIDLIVRSLVDLPGAQLAVVGPDDRGTTGELIQLAQTLCVGNRVHFTGAWREIAARLDVYADADVFVLASEDESFGIVAAEAAAAGTVPVVSDRCGVAELFGEDAGVVVPFDQGAVSAALSRLLTDPTLRERMGTSARELARRWDWQRVAQLQEQLYERALGRG